MTYFNVISLLTLSSSDDGTINDGRMARFINHCKSHPNIKAKIFEVDGKPHLCMMASKNIKVGEELEVDYGERDKRVIGGNPWLNN